MDRVAVELTSQMLATLFDTRSSSAVLPGFSRLPALAPGRGSGQRQRTEMLTHCRCSSRCGTHGRAIGGTTSFRCWPIRRPTAAGTPDLHERHHPLDRGRLGHHRHSMPASSPSINTRENTPETGPNPPCWRAPFRRSSAGRARWPTYCRAACRYRDRGQTIRKGEGRHVVRLEQPRREGHRADERIHHRPRAASSAAFGFGIHRCLGQEQMQLRVVWEMLRR